LTGTARTTKGAALLAGGAFFVLLCGCGAGAAFLFGDAEPGLPPRFAIDNVPFLPQEEETCGPTSVAMLLRFLGKEADARELVRETRTEGLRGVLITDLAAAAARRGVPLDIENLTLARLRSRLAKGTPVILLADLGAWRISIPHYMLVFGYTPHSVIAHSGRTAGKEIPYATLDRQ
jgi:hypothetical protein